MDNLGRVVGARESAKQLFFQAETWVDGRPVELLLPGVDLGRHELEPFTEVLAPVLSMDEVQTKDVGLEKRIRFA